MYILYESDRNRISGKFDHGWLDDTIISASQKLLAQQFPNIAGLQPPTLEQTKGGFTGHTGPFAQILNIRNSHWVLVSNLGCDKHVVHVYDTLYTSLPSSTINTIAGLAFCSLSELEIKMVDVDLQKNGADCGVLSVANAFNLLSARSPCSVRYADSNMLRRHLCECLERCLFSFFPTLGDQSSTNLDTTFKFTVRVGVYCVCRKPDHPDVEYMAECEGCGEWFHERCVDIPQSVFSDNEPWKCLECTKKL